MGNQDRVCSRLGVESCFSSSVTYDDFQEGVEDTHGKRLGGVGVYGWYKESCLVFRFSSRLTGIFFILGRKERPYDDFFALSNALYVAISVLFVVVVCNSAHSSHIIHNSEFDIRTR
jgi:hypothetical protein